MDAIIGVCTNNSLFGVTHYADYRFYLYELVTTRISKNPEKAVSIGVNLYYAIIESLEMPDLWNILGLSKEAAQECKRGMDAMAGGRLSPKNLWLVDKISEVVKFLNKKLTIATILVNNKELSHFYFTLALPAIVEDGFKTLKTRAEQIEVIRGKLNVEKHPCFEGELYRNSVNILDEATLMGIYRWLQHNITESDMNSTLLSLFMETEADLLTRMNIIGIVQEFMSSEGRMGVMFAILYLNIQGYPTVLEV